MTFLHRKMDTWRPRQVYRQGVTTRRARAWDALVLVLVAVVLVEVLSTDQDVPLALSVPVGLAMTVPFLWGPRVPLLVVPVVLGAWLGQALAGDWSQPPQTELLPVCLAFWCLGAYVPARVSRWALVPAFAALVAQQPDDAVVLGPLVLGVYAAGRLMRSREELAAALRLEREQAESHAVAAERTRIARDLHDVVGHAVALMTVQAGAERIALGQERPETARVLGEIETTGRQALQEVRRLLGVLRTSDDPAALAPRPGLHQLDALARSLAPAGLAVDVVVEGDGAPLSPGLDVSAYRIVQEALTNVLRHAAANRARVRITHDHHLLTIEVTDDGPGRAEPQPGAGHGLAGIRERVAVFGGSMEAGPAPQGGWCLVVRLDAEATP